MLSVQELYLYSSSVRRKFFEKLETLPWEAVVENREASHYSVRNIMLHMVDNEDWIVNWVVQNRATEYKREKKAEEYQDMKTIREHLDRVEQKTQRYLETVDEREMQR